MERSEGRETQADGTACANTLSRDRVWRIRYVGREGESMAKMQQRALGQEFGLSLWMMEMDRRVPAREVTSSDFYFERNKL